MNTNVSKKRRSYKARQHNNSKNQVHLRSGRTIKESAGKDDEIAWRCDATRGSLSVR